MHRHDQLDAACTELADTVGLMWRKLLEQGFGEDHAFELLMVLLDRIVSR